MIGKRGRLVIRTDSLNAINCVEKLAPKWETKGWRRLSGGAVKDAVGNICSRLD
jgi:ribonuclease HI